MSILYEIIECASIKARCVNLCVTFLSHVFNFLSAENDLFEDAADTGKHKQSL